jgi:hypothetical protein
MRVGITGHQELGSHDIVEWLRSKIAAEIIKQSVSLGITSLAVGADQLFATLLRQQGLPYVAIIPSKNYDKTFTEETNLRNYRQLLSHAAEITNLGFDDPSEMAFLAAGEEVVNRADVMFAIWDGEEVRGMGGTGDIVKYAKQENKPIIRFDPTTRLVTIN